MQIAKAFFLNVKQHFSILIIYMFIFCVLQLLFSEYGSSQNNLKFESTKMSLIVQDEDHSVLSQGLCDFLSDIHEVDTKKYTKEQIVDELYYENADYVLTISKGFGENLSHGDTEGLLKNQKRKGSFSGQFADEQIDQYVSILSSYLAAGYSPKAALASTKKAVSQKADITFASPKTEQNNDTIYYSFCYIPYILICILTVGLGGILITFRKTELLTRLQCSSFPTLKRNIQLGICSGVLALFCWLAFMVVNLFFIGSDIFSQQGLLSILNSFFFLLVAVSITFLVSFLAKSDDTLNMISNVVGLGLSFLGGIFVPLEVMTSSVVMFARLLPSYWYITALELIQDYTGTAAQQRELCQCLGVQLLFAIAIFCAALVASQMKKQK